jgi:hypothetical protein
LENRRDCEGKKGNQPMGRTVHAKAPVARVGKSHYRFNCKAGEIFDRSQEGQAGEPRFHSWTRFDLSMDPLKEAKASLAGPLGWNTFGNV